MSHLADLLLLVKIRGHVSTRAGLMSIFLVDVGFGFFSIFLKVGVGFGFLNNRDIGVSFDFLV